MQSSYTTVDVSSQEVSLSEPVYGGSKRKSALKTLAAIGVCAACVVLGVKLERHGHAESVENMFASTVVRAPVTSVTASLYPSASRGGKTNARAATTQPRRLRSRLNAAEDSGTPVVVEEASTPAEKDGDDAEVFKTASGAKLPFQPKMSQAIPFLENPPHLDGTMVGDRGLDPFNFGADGRLGRMREAEIKHARLAMLAAAGWPISEKLDTPLAKLVNLPVALNPDGTAPSLLNGGLDQISIYYWGAVLGASVAIEFAGRDNKEPGDYGFDPLGFSKDFSEEKLSEMKEKELKNGRLAMMAIAGFAVQEALYKTPVTQETPAFFQPFWDTLSSS